jgi:hypothetical protein
MVVALLLLLQIVQCGEETACDAMIVVPFHDFNCANTINTGQLNNPGGIAISPDGEMYISGPNDKVQIWS